MKCILDILKNWCNPLWVKQGNVSSNVIVMQYAHSKIDIGFDTIGEVEVHYSVGGVEQIATFPANDYGDLYVTNADPNTPIYIYGDVQNAYLTNGGTIPPDYIQVLNHTTLEDLEALGDSAYPTTLFDVRNNPALAIINAGQRRQLVTMNLSGNTALQSLTIQGCQELQSLILPESTFNILAAANCPAINNIYAPSVQGLVAANNIASMITNSTYNNGVLTARATDPYYNIIEPAATGKGWTIINV